MRGIVNFLIYRVPFVMPVAMFFLKRVQFALLGFYKDPADVALVSQVGSERKMLLQPLEAYTILAMARMQSALEGDMAEVGVYQGSSAKLIATVKGGRTLWGFDTFAGLKDVSEEDTHWGISFFKSGQYDASQTDVERYLAEFENVRLVAGFFPESAGAELADETTSRRFSFVHLDVDTHDSTLASLRFFWPRLVEGGIILTHDSHAAGVAKAAATFIQESRARSFETTGSQLAFLK